MIQHNVGFNKKQYFPPLSCMMLVSASSRYFFPTNVLNHMDGYEVSQAMEHEQEFFSIMEVCQWACSYCGGREQTKQLLMSCLLS